MVNKRENDKDGLRCITHIKDEALFQKTPIERDVLSRGMAILTRTKVFPIFDTQQRYIDLLE